MDSKVLNAIQHGQLKQLQMYLRHGYDLNVVTKDGRNGLFYALDIVDARRRRRMIRFCLDQGIDPLHREEINGYTALHEAIARQQVDSVQLLLANAGGEIDWRAFDKRGRTLLHQTIELNNQAILEELITVMNHYGVSVDLPDQNGLTPYLLAMKLHLRDIAQVLVEKGHASRQQCDLTTHRSVDDWQMIGLEENRLLTRQKLEQEIENAMQEGKINRVKKLKRVYHSPLLSKFEVNRRESVGSCATTISSLNMKSTLSINEILDRLPEGEIPETYLPSIPDEQTFHLESASRLPPITSTARPKASSLNLNELVDLFQVIHLEDWFRFLLTMKEKKTFFVLISSFSLVLLLRHRQTNTKIVFHLSFVGRH